MIQKAQVMPLLLEACPSFTEAWQEHREYWGQEHLLYLDLAEFARHLVELLTHNEIGELSRVFDVVERLHIEGDDGVKNAATVGLLEGLQNIAGNNGVDAETFVPFLKSESAKWWFQLNLFWEGKIPYVAATIDV